MKTQTAIAPEVGQRGFWALIVTQFQGAFSDNVLKNLVIFMIIGLNVSLAEKHKIGELVGALFSLPFIVFSMAGGYLADRFSKRTMSVGVKIFEMFVMLLALAGFARQQHLLNAGVAASLQTCWPLLGCVFLMGVHSAFFGPSKYGLLPELLPESKLSWGNGLLELGTFTAIILGTVAAAFMSKGFRGAQWWSGVILIALAVFGFFTSLGISRVPAANPRKPFSANFPGQVWAQIRLWRKDRSMFLAAVGNTYFNFLGALLLLNLFFYGADVLHVDETKIGYLNVALALGIGLGSVAAGYLSGGKIEYGLVPLGAIGLAVFSALLAQTGLSCNTALALLALLGFAGGFFIVPISALLQHRPDKTAKGETLAAANLLSFVGIFLASGVRWLLAQALQLNPREIFLVGCAPEQFGSVRVVAVAGEKLPERVASAFEDQFGIRPFEAYGCTECSPAVAVNTHDFRSAGFRQVGVKRGRIGHPLPGISVRIVDAETRQPVPLGQPGLLLVRGPNVMQGYLGLPEKTAEVLLDGWYVTGDIAALDEDGFLQITDRLSRFSKIGGEMVPHIKVEEKLHELAGLTEQTFVVGSVPDEKKGERLVVLHKLGEAKWTEFRAKLPQLDLPNLWKPRADQFYHVEALPMLGTGKLDLRKIRELAAQFSTGGAGE